MSTIQSPSYFSQLMIFFNSHLPTKDTALKCGSMIGSVAFSVLSINKFYQLTKPLHLAVEHVKTLTSIEDRGKILLDKCVEKANISFKSNSYALNRAKQECRFHSQIFKKPPLIFSVSVCNASNLVTPVFLGLAALLADYAVDRSISSSNPLQKRAKKGIYAAGSAAMSIASLYTYYQYSNSYHLPSNRYAAEDAVILLSWYMMGALGFALSYTNQ